MKHLKIDFYNKLLSIKTQTQEFEKLNKTL